MALLTALFLNLVALALIVSRPPAVPLTATPQPPTLAGSPAALTGGATPGVSPAAAGSPLPAGSPAVAGALPSPTPPLHVLHPEGKIRGFNIPVWGPDFVVATPSIRGAAALDANWVALVSHWYVSSAVPYTGGGIFRETATTGRDQQRTASDESLGQAIDDAHALGLRVLLKPHVDWIEGGWRGSFYFDDTKAPGGRAAWWTSYRAMIRDTVTLAIAHQADGICIGTEFADINKEPASAGEWIHIINEIRAAGYTGALTYAANWGYGGDAEYNRPGLTGVWELLDFVGVDAYFPLSTGRDPTLDELAAGWRDAVNPYDTRPVPMHQDHVAELDRLHRRTGKPIVFTEVGYPPIDYPARFPGKEETGPDNEAAQSRAATALYQVWAGVPWWGGALWWQYGPSYNLYSLQGRPIVDALRAAWSKIAVSAQP